VWCEEVAILCGTGGGRDDGRGWLLKLHKMLSRVTQAGGMVLNNVDTLIN